MIEFVSVPDASPPTDNVLALLMGDLLVHISETVG